MGATDESARSEMAGEFKLTEGVAEDSKGGQWMQAEEYVGGPLGSCWPRRGCKQRTWTSLRQAEQGNTASIAMAPKHAGQSRPPPGGTPVALRSEALVLLQPCARLPSLHLPLSVPGRKTSHGLQKH